MSILDRFLKEEDIELETTAIKYDKTKRFTGKIIHTDKVKGFGFITSEEIPFTRIYFHWTGLKQDTLNFLQLDKNINCEFSIKQFDDGRIRAIKIRVL